MKVREETIVSRLSGFINEYDNNFTSDVELSENNKYDDLVVKKNKKILFTGEFKRPTIVEGFSPRNIKLIEDAFNKATKVGSRYFITSNFNETVIWDNRDYTIPLINREIHRIFLQNKIKKNEDFEKEQINEQLKKMIVDIIIYIDNLQEKNIDVSYKPIGDGFVLGLNSHLDVIVESAYKNVKNKILTKWWMEQEYEPVKFFEDDQKKQLVRYTAYKLANKIVFYNIMQRSFKDLPDIAIPNNLDTAKMIKGLIQGAFEEAQKISGDFEPIFEVHEADEILFSENKLSIPIKALIDYLNQYKIDKMSQASLGNIYDRLISREQRHALGQYYTPIPIVDLINVLTIMNKDDRVMDPACGTMTFGSQAFEYKLLLAKDDNQKLREKFMEEIFGIDIAPYPVHLAMMAMSGKLLFMDPKIYPKIIRKNFFDVNMNDVIPKYRTLYTDSGPVFVETLNGEKKRIVFKPIDVIVSNLPYIRQEQIENKEKQLGKIKKMLETNGFYDAGLPTKTSDFHIYFWYYLLPFLKEGSRIGFLTSDTWMNVEYGIDFKQYLNKFFKIKYIIDSSVERWFEDALVNTNIMILERCSKKQERDDNLIYFIRINEKINDLIPDIKAAVKIKDQIFEKTITDKVEIKRKLRQGDIDFKNIIETKFYSYLKAPNEFFQLTKNMIPLKEVMDIQRGFTTGANEFFYVTDITNSIPPEELMQKYGLRKGETKNIRIIKDGNNVVHLLEKKYLQNIMKSPKEFTSTGKLDFFIKTKKKVVLINESTKNEINKFALEYIEYGENNPPDEPYSNRPTCKNRNPWWKLTPVIYPDIVLTMYFYSTFLYPKTRFLLDHQLYLGRLKKAYKEDIIGIFSFLNSTLTYLFPDIYGRNYGGGAAGFMVYETEMLPIPDPKLLRPYYKKLDKLMKNLEKRKIGNIFDEVWDTKKPFTFDSVKKDRLELDRTLLTAIGYEDPDEFLNKWYPAVVNIIKERQVKAASLKTKSTNSGSDLNQIADEILQENSMKDFPNDYLLKEEIKEMFIIVSGKNIDYKMNYAGIPIVVIDDKNYTFDNMATAEYVYHCAARGMTQIPIPKDIKHILQEFKEDLQNWKTKLNKEIKSLSDDVKTQEKIKNSCLRKANYFY